MFLYSIDVFPRFQRRGVATALIEELKRLAAARNCSEIFVLTNENNPAANRLYQKRSEEHTSELQSRPHLVCRLLLEKKNKQINFFAASPTPVSIGYLMPSNPWISILLNVLV